MMDPQRKLWTTADGKYWVQDTNSPEGGYWAEALNTSPIYLADTTLYPPVTQDFFPPDYHSLPLDYYRAPGAENIFASVEKTQDYSSHIPDDRLTTTFPNSLLSNLIIRLHPDKSSPTQITPDELMQSYKDIAGGKVSLALDVRTNPYDISTGTTRYWSWDQGVVVLQVPWEQTNGDASFFGEHSSIYRWKLEVEGGNTSDNPGRLMVIIASKGNLTDRQKAEMTVFPVISAILYQQLPPFDYYSDNPTDAQTFLDEKDTRGVDRTAYFNALGKTAYDLAAVMLTGNLENQQDNPFLTFH